MRGQEIGYSAEEPECIVIPAKLIIPDECIVLTIGQKLVLTPVLPEG